MQRVLRFGVVAAVLVVLVALRPAGAPARTAAHISLSSPRAYQVFQRDARGRGVIVVRGVATGFTGQVQVRWGDSAWSSAPVRSDGSFSLSLVGCPGGQAGLVVRSADRHETRASRARVGVGDIYVIAGQSNASGRSSHTFYCRHPALRAAVFGNDYRWSLLTDPVDSAAGQKDVVSRDPRAGGSVWPLVAEKLMREEDVPVAVVPCARGASSLERWSRPAHLARKTLFGSMVRRVRAVGGHVRAVLFWQGEADARDPEAASLYHSRLLALARAVRRDLHAPLVVAQIGDYGCAYTGDLVDAVRCAQARSWGEAGVVAGPVLYDIDLGAVVHFDEEDDIATAARRWSACILRGVLGRRAPAAPRLLQAVLAGREVLLTADGRLAPATALGGFVVRDDGGEVPVESAVAETRDLVRITLGRDPDGAVTVSLGEGRSAAGAAVPVESSSWRLPLLPFVGWPVTVLP